MSVDALKEAISELPETDFKVLREWFSDADELKWDQEIAADSQAGRLDFLKEEAKQALDSRSLSDL